MNVFDKVSKVAKNFIEKALKVKGRFSADNCVCHPWIYENNSKKS